MPFGTSEKGVRYYLTNKINNTISQNVCLELNVNKQIYVKNAKHIFKLKFLITKWIYEKQTH
jgi:hypothetical protein